jgi:hypothetical protein
MDSDVLDKWPALKTLPLAELQARKDLNELIMRSANHPPERVKEFTEINDILLLAINNHPDSPKP